MTDVPEGFPKLDKATRPWTCRADDPDCTRSKPCARCRGARNRRKGKRKQNQVRKELDRHFGTAGRMSTVTANEENWRHRVRAEVKAGKQVGPVATAFLKAEKQSEAARPVGDPRPFVWVAMPDDMSDGIVAFRLSALEAVVSALLEGQS